MGYQYIVVHKKYKTRASIDIAIFSESNLLKIETGHGNNGTITIISPNGNKVTNSMIDGSGQNLQQNELKI